MLFFIYIAVFAFEVAMSQDMKKTLVAFLEKATVFFIVSCLLVPKFKILYFL